MAQEINFDGLVGPTYNHSGFSSGNIASTKNHNIPSNPKQAALQGLKKMHTLHQLGVPQALLPPHERPFLPFLRKLGFEGCAKEILSKVSTHPHLLSASMSASAMWTANAATVSPSIDSADSKTHITIANLQNQLHRHIESESNVKIFSSIFFNKDHFSLHPPLPTHTYFQDEGAANHTRFCTRNDSSTGLHLFVYGKDNFSNENYLNQYPARQSRQACEAIVRLHKLSQNQVVFAKQNPEAIDAGVFHNDVISTGHQQLFLTHQQAFVDQVNVLNALREQFKRITDSDLHIEEISNNELPLKNAVESYLFNSQIVTTANGDNILLAPTECDQDPKTKAVIDRLLHCDIPIKKAIYLPLRESMQGGGGPACLRLRIPLTQSQQDAIPSKLFIDDKMYKTLCHWVNKHYRDEIYPRDLMDPDLIDETYTALDELTSILNLRSIYFFQF